MIIQSQLSRRQVLCGCLVNPQPLINSLRIEKNNNGKIKKGHAITADPFKKQIIML